MKREEEEEEEEGGCGEGKKWGRRVIAERIERVGLHLMVAGGGVIAISLHTHIY